MCPESPGVGLGDALGISFPGISILGIGVVAVDGVGDGEADGGLLTGIVWP